MVRAVRRHRETKKDSPAMGHLFPAEKSCYHCMGALRQIPHTGIGMLTVRLTTTPFSTRNYTMNLMQMQALFFP